MVTCPPDCGHFPSIFNADAGCKARCLPIVVLGTRSRVTGWRLRRRRNNFEKPRERRTLVPAFNPEELAAKIENEANCETSRPPFDPSDYARTIEEHADVIEHFDATEAPTETESLHILPALPEDVPSEPSLVAEVSYNDDSSYGDRAIAIVVSEPGSMVLPPQNNKLALDDTAEPTQTEDIGREMYSSYLASDFPEALVLAERVLELEPAHALAQLVVDRCRERLRPAPGSVTPLRPSSVVRLKFSELERQSKHIDARTSFVLGHVDGVTDAGTVAALSGLPPPEALDRLHALLDLGVIEVVA